MHLSSSRGWFVQWTICWLDVKASEFDMGWLGLRRGSEAVRVRATPELPVLSFNFSSAHVKKKTSRAERANRPTANRQRVPQEGHMTHLHVVHAHRKYAGNPSMHGRKRNGHSAHRQTTYICRLISNSRNHRVLQCIALLLNKSECFKLESPSNLFLTHGWRFIVFIYIERKC